MNKLTCSSPMHATTASVSLYVCQSCIVLKALFHWCPPPPLALRVFPSPFLHSSLSPRPGDLMGSYAQQQMDDQHKRNSPHLWRLLVSQCGCGVLIFIFIFHVTGHSIVYRLEILVFVFMGFMYVNVCASPFICVSLVPFPLFVCFDMF